MRDYVRFSIAPYCLAKLLLALNASDIHTFSITQEDNELMVSVSVKELERIVYHIKEQGEECSCGQ